MRRALRKLAGLAAYLCTGCSVLSTVVAEEYSWQVSAGYRDGNAGTALTLDRFLRTTYYLSPVDDTIGPYELAPFLNRSSYVAVGTSRTKLREEAYLNFGTRPITGNDTLTGNAIGVWGAGALSEAARAFSSESGIDASEYDVGGRYVWPGSGWYAGVRARRGDGDVLPQLPFLQTAVEFTRTGLFAGRYFGLRTAAEVDLGSESMSQEDMHAGLFVDPLSGLPEPVGLPSLLGGAPAGFRIVTDEETDNARVSVRHVGDLGDSTFEFSASVRASRSDFRMSVPLTPDFFTSSNPFEPPFDPYGNLIGVVGAPAIESGWSEREREVRLSGALFPDEALGVRLTLSTSDRDAWGTSDRVALSAQWFFVPCAAVGVELTRSRSGRGYVPNSHDTDSVSVRLLGRF